MRTRITLNTFRKVGRMEETMMRAAMPRTSAQDEAPLPIFAAVDLVTVRSGVRLVRPLTATISEVARGRKDEGGTE